MCSSGTDKRVCKISYWDAISHSSPIHNYCILNTTCRNSQYQFKRHVVEKKKWSKKGTCGLTGFTRTPCFSTSENQKSAKELWIKHENCLLFYSKISTCTLQNFLKLLGRHFPIFCIRLLVPNHATKKYIDFHSIRKKKLSNIQQQMMQGKGLFKVLFLAMVSNPILTLWVTTQPLMVQPSQALRHTSSESNCWSQALRISQSAPEPGSNLGSKHW